MSPAAGAFAAPEAGAAGAGQYASVLQQTVLAPGHAAQAGAAPAAAAHESDMPCHVEQPAAAGAARPETVGDKAARLRNKPTLTAHSHQKRLEELAGVRRAFQRITEGAADAIARAFHDAKQRRRSGDDRPLQAITHECVGRLRGG